MELRKEMISVAKSERFPYTNIDDIFDELETKPDTTLDKPITVRKACLIALDQCKNIFEPNGILWNQAIDAVVNGLRNYAKSEQSE